MRYRRIGSHPTRLPITSELLNIQVKILMRYQATTDSGVLVSPTRLRRGAGKKGHKKAQKYTKIIWRKLASPFRNLSCAFCAFLWLIHQSVADSVVREFSVGLHVHFVEDAAAIGADGLIAE